VSLVCVASSVALSTLLDTYIDPTEPDASHGPSDAGSTSSRATTVDVPSTPSMKKAKKAVATAEPSTPKILDKRHRLRSLPSLAAFLGFDFRLVVVLNTIGMLAVFVAHCTWVTSTACVSHSQKTRCRLCIVGCVV